MIHKMIIITLMITYVGVVRCDVNENEEFVNLNDLVKRVQKKFSKDDMVKLSNDVAKIYEVLANINAEDTLTAITDDDVVKLKNFKHTFFDVEQHLNSRDSCSGKCEDYQNVSYNANGCSGSVRGCVTSNVSVEVDLQHPQEDRIYSGISTYRRCESCKPKFINDGNKIIIKSGTEWFYSCDVCSCTCDHHGSENTVRSFYLGEMKAPPQYVVTGTRFVEHNRAIFLQIQVGKMVTLGLIDQKTVKWQDLPNDTEDNHYFSLTYDKDSVIFNADLCIGVDGVVIGLFFEEFEFGVRLRTIKTLIADRFLGRLTESALALEDCYPTDKSLIWSFDDKFPYSNPDISMKPESFLRSRPIGIRFGTSSFEKDIGQSTVPYFDGSKVTHIVKVPLSRIDFFVYANHKNYAGLIRPVLIPHN